MNPADPLALGALACIAFLLSVLGFVALGRAADRHRRGLVRARVHALLVTWRAYVRTGRGAREVGKQSRTVGDTLFWSALESLAIEMDRSELRILSEVLARAPHVRTERRALRDDSPWRRELAARRLGLVHCGDARRSLRRAVEQGPEPVAFRAAFALAHQRDGWALRWILDHPAYFASRPPRSRTALLRAFGKAATPILADRLAAGVGDEALERSIIERLGAAHHLAAAPVIRSRITSERLELRIAAVRAMSQLDPAAHLDALVDTLSDPAWEVRAQGARALGMSGVADTVPVIAATLTDRSWWVRHHAAYALAKLGAEGRAALSGEAIVSPDRYARDMAREVVEQTARTRGEASATGGPTKPRAIIDVALVAAATLATPPAIADAAPTDAATSDAAHDASSAVSPPAPPEARIPTRPGRTGRARTPAEITAALRSAVRRKRSA